MRVGTKGPTAGDSGTAPWEASQRHHHCVREAQRSQTSESEDDRGVVGTNPESLAS